MGTFDPKQYWSDRLARSYSLVGVGWLSLGEPFNRWMYRVRAHVFRRVARPLLRGVVRPEVLDVGSGTGFYVGLWQQLGARVTASDLTEVAVDRLRAAFPAAQARELDVTAEPPAELLGRFDAVSAMDVLFHVVDDEAYAAALRNLGRLVRPGGHVVISENFLRDGEQRTEHQVSRRLDDIEHLLGESGLTPISRRPMFVLMNTPVDRPRPLQRRAWDAIAGVARRGERASQALGAMLYPVELALTALLREGPSTEVMVCRRTG